MVEDTDSGRGWPLAGRVGGFVFFIHFRPSEIDLIFFYFLCEILSV